MEGLMKRMMISCDKATYLISKGEEKKLSCKERYQLNVHLMGCKFCRRYKKEIQYIDQALDKIKDKSKITRKLSPVEKNNIQESLNREMKKDE